MLMYTNNRSSFTVPILTTGSFLLNRKDLDGETYYVCRNTSHYIIALYIPFDQFYDPYIHSISKIEMENFYEILIIFTKVKKLLR